MFQGENSETQILLPGKYEPDDESDEGWSQNCTLLSCAKKIVLSARWLRKTGVY
jgi:hypothetical protein